MNTHFAIGWRQVFICFMLLAASGMIAATYSIIAVPFAEAFSVNRKSVMLSMTVLSAMGALITPALGDAMDRVSVRKLMLIGGVLLAMGFAAMSFATQFTHIVIIYALFVAPANVLIGPVASTVLLSRWFAEQRGRAMGLAIAGVSVGGIVFSLIIRELVLTFDWREALQWLGLILLVWTVPAAFLVSNRPSDHGLHPDGAAEPSALTRAETARDAVPVMAVLGDPAFWMIAATVAIVTSGMKGMTTNLTFVGTANGIKASDASLLITLYSTCSLISKLGFALVADRVGARVLMLLSLGGFAGGMACLTQASGGYAIIASGVALVGLFGGLMVPIESYLAPRVFGQKAVGRAMGMLSGLIMVALLASPLLYGFVFDLTGSYRAIFVVFGGLALAGLLWVPAIRLHPREGA